MGFNTRGDRVTRVVSPGPGPLATLRLRAGPAPPPPRRNAAHRALTRAHVQPMRTRVRWVDARVRDSPSNASDSCPHPTHRHANAPDLCARPRDFVRESDAPMPVWRRWASENSGLAHENDAGGLSKGALPQKPAGCHKMRHRRYLLPIVILISACGNWGPKLVNAPVIAVASHSSGPTAGTFSSLSSATTAYAASRTRVLWPDLTSTS